MKAKRIISVLLIMSITCVCLAAPSYANNGNGHGQGQGQNKGKGNGKDKSNQGKRPTIEKNSRSKKQERRALKHKEQYLVTTTDTIDTYDTHTYRRQPHRFSQKDKLILSHLNKSLVNLRRLRSRTHQRAD